MTKNPVLNAVAATLYITALSLMMNYASQFSGPTNTVLAPIAFLSLFTFSVAVMGYLFVYQPLLLLLDGKKKAAVDFFLKTLGVFGVVTAFVFALLLSGLFK